MDDAEIRRGVDAEEARRARRVASSNGPSVHGDRRVAHLLVVLGRYCPDGAERRRVAEELAATPHSLGVLERAIGLRFGAEGPRTAEVVADLAEGLEVSDWLVDLRARARMGDEGASSELERVRQRLRGR